MDNIEKIHSLKTKNKYSFSDFVEIIHILRQPYGCPWDREQTHQSIRKSLIEETYEACEAIDTQNIELLKEELGDIMLQVLLHSEMEAEKGVFTVDDVIDAECRKMIYRHPHVFGEVEASTTDTVLDNWDKLKKKEKSQKTDTDTLKSVAASLPALMRAYKVRKKAAKAGLDTSGSADRLEKLVEKYRRNGGSEEIAGDIIFEAVGIATECDAEAEEALTRRVDKFIADFEKVEQNGAIKGKKLGEL